MSKATGVVATLPGGGGEPSSPVQKVWKPELFKIQLDAPAPHPVRCQRTLPLPPSGATADAVEDNKKAVRLYGTEYHGVMGHLEAEQLLANTCDGSYLVRRSPKADGYCTMSVRFNKRTKHFKVFHKPGYGHYLREQDKHYDTMYEMVADGLVNFHMQLHASPILQQINEQTKNCYQQSPYVTLNRRKLRELSFGLGKASVAADDCDAIAAVQPDGAVMSLDSQNCQQTPQQQQPQQQIAVDPMPLVYEKPHNFKVHTFKGLNWCEFCANFLWGFTAQGVKCDACGFMAHYKCSKLVPPKCVPDMKCMRGVFGTDLTTMVQLHQCNIPFVVRRCVEEVEARGMLQEGIYRVSGFADEIDALKLALDRDGDKTDMSEATYGNVNVIAGTLKLYLRLLPVPLITFQAYPNFMAAGRNAKPTEQLQLMSEAVRRLPPAHYSCLHYMLEHLKRVASHYAVNKMNEHNLATVFAPTLIATPQHMTNLTEEIFMLSSLITHCETVFACS